MLVRKHGRLRPHHVAVGVLLASLCLGFTAPLVRATLRLNKEKYQPGEQPVMCYDSTGSQPRLPAWLFGPQELFIEISPMPLALSTSPFPPLFVGELPDGKGTLTILLNTVSCSTEDRFIQGFTVDQDTGQLEEITNEVVVVVDKTSCDPLDPMGGEGCGPGFWRNPIHFDEWPLPIHPDIQFGDIFEDAFPGKTLIQVLNQQAGPLQALGRQIVTALLNAESSAVDYDLTILEVIALFNDVFPSTNAEYSALAMTLHDLNAQGCLAEQTVPLPSERTPFSFGRR